MKAASKKLKPELYPKGEVTKLWLPLYQDATGRPVDVPFLIARGVEDGPTMGIASAVHGNELNGIRIIHNLLRYLDLNQLRGSLLCAPVVNVPAFNDGSRLFPDGLDLNHVFPGKPDGRPAEQYARSFVHAFLPNIDFLIDIHTASVGRTNTMYVRADLTDSVSQQMAEAFNPEIILQARGSDGTLRRNALKKGVPSITVEAGNPNVFQGRIATEGDLGVRNILIELGFLPGEKLLRRDPVYCPGSTWLRTTGGGLLEPRFRLFDRVKKGVELAVVLDLFGERIRSYTAPYDGIVIGMAANPVYVPGTRFCHFGRLHE